MALIINTATTSGTDYSSRKIQNGNSIFAGNLGPKNNSTNDLITQKRGLVQKQAMKLIGDAWNKDTKTAQGIADMEKNKADKESELQDFKLKLKDIEHSKSSIREEYGIDPDSQEQKDLELLEKYQNYMGGAFDETFSKEEVERLRELQNMPRTEYQNKVLASNAATGAIKLEAYKKEQEITRIKYSISGAKNEQLKSRDMINASNAADDIMDAVSDEIIGVLVQHGVDQIDEKMTEEQEKVEEAQEKKEEFQEKIDKAKDNQEELQEKIDEAKDNRKEQEAILEGAAKADKIDMDAVMQQKTTTSVEIARKQIQKILKENNLVNEDLKGIKIDFNF